VLYNGEKRKTALGKDCTVAYTDGRVALLVYAGGTYEAALVTEVEARSTHTGHDVTVGSTWVMTGSVPLRVVVTKVTETTVDYVIRDAQAVDGHKAFLGNQVSNFRNIVVRYDSSIHGPWA
jgi:hypothetical protein